MNFNEIGQGIAKELATTLGAISEAECDQLVASILRAKKIMVAGAGRSGFMVRAFAMRLMHMGFEAYVVGETIAPSLAKGDLLVIGSGSGETSGLVSMANKAKKLEAELALVTAVRESSIGGMADIVVKISAPTPKNSLASAFSSIQPMGSLFEQSLLLFLDAVIIRLMEAQGNDSKTMFTRHANLE